jgi:hypothetical protein
MAVGDQNYKVSLSFRDEATGKFIKATSDMTASMQKLGITTKKEATGAAADLDKMGKGADEAGRHSRYLGTEIGALAGKIGSMRNMLLVWMFALRPILAFTKDAIKFAQDQEIAENKLAAAFERTGKGNAESVKNLIAYSSQLQATTGFSDDQIIAAQAMLATYKLNARQIREVTPLILDMTTAIKSGGNANASLADTAKTLGYALSGNVTYLQRNGVVLSETTKKTKEYSSIIKDVTAAVGGAAIAMAGTFSGQAKIMGAAFNDLKEAFGRIVIQSPVIQSAMKMMTDSITNFTKSVDASNASSKTYTQTWLYIATVFIAIGAQIKLVWRLFLEFLNIIQIVAFKIIEFFSKIILGINAIVTAFASVIPGMKGIADQLIKFGDGVEEWSRASKLAASNSIKDFNNAASAIGNTGNEILDTYAKLVEGSSLASETQNNQFKLLNNSIEDTSDVVKTKYDAWVEISTSTAKAMRDSMADGFFKVVRGEFDGLMDVVASFGDTVLKILMQALATKAMIGIGLGGFLGLAHTGGYMLGSGSFGNIRKFHAGGMSNDEMPAILKRNEGVVNERGMNSLGVDNLNRLNRGDGFGGGGDTISNFYIQAIDVKSFRDRLEQHGDIYSNASAANVRGNGVLRKANQKYSI